MSGPIFHALGLHMHQPPGNLRLLIEHNEWEAQQIIRCYERAARYAHVHADVAFLHVGFSGILLEQFRDPEIIERYRPFVDIPAMLGSYRTAPNIELVGMGYYHPIFPLIPREDWADQLRMGRELMRELFGRAPRGFWPPEMAFSMDMIPALVEAGYEYVVVDSVHVQPADGRHDIYRPYRACHEGRCITVIPRDRDLSNAQESGLDAAWFANEVRSKVSQSPRPDEPRLVTTWSDGENGGWFRQMDENAGFFGHYFAPYMGHVRSGEYPLRPISIPAFLEANPPADEAQVQTGAWNVGGTSGYDFAQWTGSESQKRAVAKVHEVSTRWRSLAERKPAGKARKLLEQVRTLVLEGETSCYLFWGDAWIPHLYERTERAEGLLREAEQALTVTPAETKAAPTVIAKAPAKPTEPAKPTAPAAQQPAATPAPATTASSPAAVKQAPGQKTAAKKKAAAKPGAPKGKK